MNLKSCAIFISILVIWTLFSFTKTQTNKTNSFTSTDTPHSYLFLFGEYIYKREKCNSCHSLNITDNKTKISLDGLPGKYPISWHYIHLIDPTSMVHDSEMPSFIFLSDKSFEKDTIEKYLNKISKQDWNNLIFETKTLKKDLKKYGIDSKSNLEIIALLHFLNNIPQSEECKIIRSKELEKANREKHIIDSIWASSDSIIKYTINNKENIPLGQAIYKANCTPCHGSKGEGAIGPNLADNFWLNGGSDNNLVKTIVNGIPQKGMKSWKYNFTPIEVGQLISYIKSIKGSNPENAKISQGKME